MIKIKLCEPHIHRNETTFRPFMTAYNTFKDVGIEFTLSDDYDYAFVGQASIIDKKKPLQESIDKGLEFVSKITGDYIIVDGQDATTLIGTIDVFRESNATLFLKNSYLKDFDLYKQSWANGRMYWGEGDYSVPDIDELKPKMKLTGCNWLSTMTPQWFDSFSEKKYDISCMFGYPSKQKVYEHNLCQTDYYDLHRKNLLEIISNKYNFIGLNNGQKVSMDEYFKRMSESKIVMSPFGFGEMNPRDVQSAMLGSVLIEPDMSYILSKPFIYENDETYVAVNYDWSDLEEKIDYVLSDYENIRDRLVQNFRRKFVEIYDTKNLVLHFYNVLKGLDDVE
tara:strand:+ start:1311 stop:2321 length:1011 start_codon:yes stop_codon:yes gene_type:complete